MNIFGLDITRKASRVNDPDQRAKTSLQMLGAPIWTRRNYRDIAQNTYSSNVYAFRCIDFIAKAISQLPIGIAKGDKVLFEGAAADWLNNPSVRIGRNESLYAIAANMMLSGNAYIEAVRKDKGLPYEWYVLRSDRMKIIADQFGLPAQFVHWQDYQYGGAAQRFETKWDIDVLGYSDVCHIKSFNPLDDYYGQSPIFAALQSIDQNNAANALNKALMDSAGRPSGALVYDPKEGPETLTDDQYSRLKREMDMQAQSGSAKPLVLEGGLRWTPFAMNMRDLEWINSKKMSATDITVALGVPGQLVGIEGSQTYANYEQARLAFYEETVMPLAELVIDNLNRWASQWFDTPFAIDWDSVQALQERRFMTYERLEKLSFMTTNEKRLQAGYEALTGADDLLVSSGLTPLAMLADTTGARIEQMTAPKVAAPSVGAEPNKPVDSATPPKGQAKGAGFETAWHLKDSLAHIDRLSAEVQGDLAKTLATSGVRIANAYPEIDAALKTESQHLEQILGAHLRKTWAVGAKQVAWQFKQYEADYESKGLRRDVQKWITANVAERVVGINKTTADIVRAEVRKGITAGLGSDAIANAIKTRTGGKFSTERAQTIARTETHAAYSKAQHKEAELLSKELNIEMVKTWMSHTDGRERDAHSLANGATVDLNENFVVGGEAVQSPADFKQAGNAINCRCVVDYRTKI
jgi:HK97 family phage portal protein